MAEKCLSHRKVRNVFCPPKSIYQYMPLYLTRYVSLIACSEARVHGGVHAQVACFSTLSIRPCQFPAVDLLIWFPEIIALTSCSALALDAHTGPGRTSASPSHLPAILHTGVEKARAIRGFKCIFWTKKKKLFQSPRFSPKCRSAARCLRWNSLGFDEKTAGNSEMRATQLSL